ncbi:hypothetical protein Tco_1190186 [Tanacetum coccineum]
MKEQAYNIDRDKDHKSLMTKAISLISRRSVTMNSLQGRLLALIIESNKEVRSLRILGKLIGHVYRVSPAGCEFFKKPDHFCHPIIYLLSLFENGVLKSFHPFDWSSQSHTYDETRHNHKKSEFEDNDRCHNEGIFIVSPRNESMVQIEILLDVVGTSGYRCGVLQSFLVERIKQGNK